MPVHLLSVTKRRAELVKLDGTKHGPRVFQSLRGRVPRVAQGGCVNADMPTRRRVNSHTDDAKFHRFPRRVRQTRAVDIINKSSK